MWVSMTTEQLTAMWGNAPAKTQTKLTSQGNEEVQLYKIRVGDWKTGIKTEYYKVIAVGGKIVELQQLEESVGSL